MRDVVDQLDRYQDYLDTRFPAVTSEEVFELASRPIDETTVPQHLARWRAAVAFGAAFAAIILLGAVAYVVAVTTSRSEPAVSPDVVTTSPPWNPVPTDPPWGRVVVESAALPNGGLVVLTTTPQTVSWSPDGVSWFDVDSGGDVAGFLPRWDGAYGPQMRPNVLAVAGDFVGVVDREDDQVWIGRPGHSGWQAVSPDTARIHGEIELMTIAGGPDQFLVVARTVGTDVLEVDDPEAPLSVPSTDAYSVWIVDPASSSAARHVLPIPVPEWTTDVSTAAVWVGGRWLVLLPRNVVSDSDEGWSPDYALVSPDGVNWSSAELPEDFSSVTSVAASDAMLIATVCDFGGDSFWYSTTGLDWAKATSDHLGHASTYVEGLGFVVRYDDAWVVSPDGINWQSPAGRGVTLRNFEEGTGPASELEGGLFEFDNQMWRWSMGSES
jgi:hypothetical protein